MLNEDGIMEDAKQHGSHQGTAFVHAKYLKLYIEVSGGTNEVERKADGVGFIKGGMQ